MAERLEYFKKTFYGQKSELIIDEEKAVCKSKLWCFPESEEQVVLKDVRFFDTSGSSINFGYKDRIEMKGLSKSEAEEIREHLSSHGAKLGEDANWVKKGWGNCLFPSEQVAVLPEGLMYKWKKGRNTESSFVQWDAVNIAVFPKGGLCNGDYIILQGELDVSTSKRFPDHLISEIKKHLSGKGMGAAGDAFRPSIFKGCRDHFQNCVVLTDKAVVVKLSKKSLGSSEMPQNAKKKSGTTISIPYENVSKIRVSKWNKKYISIEGNITDLRTSEAATIKARMPKPFIFSWWKLKRLVKDRIR